MHNLFLVFFVSLCLFQAYLGPSSGVTTVWVHSWYLLFFLDDCLLSWFNLYMFWAYLCPSSGGTTICMLQLVLIILFRWLSVVLVGRKTDIHLKRIISANFYIHTVVWRKFVGSETVCKNLYALGRRSGGKTYHSFATRVSQLKIWHFWITGVERNDYKCTFNRYSVITQFAKLAAGQQLCRRCTHRKL